MAYIFKGKLCGRICDDCQEDLSDVQVKLYSLRKDQQETVLATANPKNTMTILDKKQLDNKSDFLIAEASTDDDGRFSFELGENQDYDGEAFELDIYLETVPGLSQEDIEREPVQFTVTTLQPKWRQRENNFVWVWEYCLSSRFWCRIRELFGAWVICGRVVQCQTEAPIGEVTVTAFDRDWIEDDALGTATTDSSGRFRIDYPASAFKQGTFIDVELFGGPDLYFHIESTSGDALLAEAPARGRDSDRENAGACFCVELCIDIDGNGEPPGPFVPTVWTDVGKTRFTIPDASGLNDFDAQGFGVAGANHYAFTGNALKMMGSVPYLDNPFTVEYRFRVSDTGGVNGAAPLPESGFTRTVGAGADADLFVDGVVLGRVIRLSPFKIVKVRSRKVELDNGWLDIKEAIEQAFIDDPDVTPADIPAFIGDAYGGWDPDVLLAIDTQKLSQPVSPGGVSEAGDPVPSSELVDVNDQRFAIRFEIRLRNTATNATTLLPANGTTLNAIILDNTAAIRRLQMVDHFTDPCDPLSGQVDVAYTAYHPHLSSASIHVESNEDPPVFDKNLDDANLPLSINQDSNGVDPINNGSLNINTGQVGSDQALHKCTYLVTLNLNARLHTGDSGVNIADPQTTFYYEG